MGQKYRQAKRIEILYVVNVTLYTLKDSKVCVEVLKRAFANQRAIEKASLLTDHNLQFEKMSVNTTMNVSLCRIHKNVDIIARRSQKQRNFSNSK